MKDRHQPFQTARKIDFYRDDRFRRCTAPAEMPVRSINQLLPGCIRMKDVQLSGGTQMVLGVSGAGGQ